jgi:phosphatidylglycerol lysyltransferase
MIGPRRQSPVDRPGVRSVSEENPSEIPPSRAFDALPRAALPLAAIAACTLTLFLLREPSHAIGYHAIVRVLRRMPLGLVSAAVWWTVLSYLAMVAAERCACTYIGVKVPPAALFLGSFCASALGNAVGFGALSGRSVRDRVYGAVAVPPELITTFTLFSEAGYGLALLVLAALSALCAGDTLGRILSLQMGAIRLLGVGLLIPIAVVLAALRRRSIVEIGQVSLAAPPMRVAVLELVALTATIGTACAALWYLLPAGQIGFFSFSVIFAAATALGVLSRIPAGLGAFDGVIFLALAKVAPPNQIAGALLVYRGVYFVLPLLLASASLAVFELRLPSARPAATAGERVLAQAGSLAPSFLSVVTFAGGVMLVISGATPAVDWRLAAIQRILPLWAVEISHLVATLAGVFLLFVARGLYHRLDGAWWLALIVAVANVAFSLAKGLAFGETAAMIFLIFLLLATRRQFIRPAAFLREPFTARWTAAIAVVIMAAVGILFFAFRNVAYRREIWWQFEFDAQASRALRALLGASVLALGVSLWQMLRAAPGRVEPSSPAQLANAERIVLDQEHSAAMLALMGDKSFLFSGSGNAFLMYAKRGRTWVALFDPVGAQHEWLELVWQFVELAARHDGRAAFYQIRPETLPIYLDAGLRVIKVGEEACIYLKDFSLAGSHRYGLRQSLKRAERDGLSFEVFAPHQPGAHPDTLKDISEAWLASHHATERGFSVAAFVPQFNATQSIVLSRLHGKPLAFITFMSTRRQTEATVGLMRYLPDAPPYAMEFMLTRLALELKERGFTMLSLGMAPLAGLVRTSLSSRAHLIAGLLWEHGGPIYNFQGLRSFKNKFRPAWEPRYLAASGTIGPFITLADVAALASGYLRR